MEKQIEYKNYMELVDSVRKGSVIKEREARELAEKHGFELNSLDEALLTGYKVKFERYAFMLSRGVTVYEGQARELAKRQGWDLEKAVEKYESLKKVTGRYESEKIRKSA